MKPSNKEILNQIEILAGKNPDIEVVWLYGSHATGEAHFESDFDLAIAFRKFVKDPLERALRPEKLAMEWMSQFKLPEKKLSIIDINNVPIPLAWEVISKGRVIYHTESGRQYSEFDRISRQYELDICYHRKIYG